jgi:hypothetical protein
MTAHTPTRTDGVRLAHGPRGTTVHTGHHPRLGRVTVTVLDPDADLDTVHAWVTAPGTEFWGLGDLSRDDLRELYAFVDSLETHHAFLVRVEDTPVALLQTYDPAHDPVGERYAVQPGDVGVHLLVGRGDARVPGYSGMLIGAMGEFVLGQPGARRIVVEPDVRNERAVARMVRSGFELGPVIELPQKTAQLAFFAPR